MPHAVRLMTRMNELFSHPLREDHKGILDNGASLSETLSDLGLFEGLDDTEVSILAGSLGESVQAAILAALRSAALRDLPVVFQWQPSRYGSASLFEAVDEDGHGMIGCTVRVPWLRDARSMGST